KICHISQVKKDGKDVDEGRIVDGDNSKWDSCRVPRELKVNNIAITTLFMNFWRNTIESYWSRPGFTLEVLVVNLDKLSASKKSAYEKNRISWQVRLNHNTNNRPTYKAVAFKPVPIYAGIDSSTIAHEFGHTIGL